MEYVVLKCSLEEMETVLNEYGKTGWRLIKIINTPSGLKEYSHNLVMERSKE